MNYGKIQMRKKSRSSRIKIMKAKQDGKKRNLYNMYVI